MTHSESIKELATALAKAQGQIEGAKKDSRNPHFGNRYADLASVWYACRKALSENGLSVSQHPCPVAYELTPVKDSWVGVETMLMHSSGEWLKSAIYVPVSKPDAQGHGSAITYARRYALAAVVGVAPEDDDGEAAVGRPQASQDRTEPKRIKPDVYPPIGKKIVIPDDPTEAAKQAFEITLKDPKVLVALSTQGWNMTGLGRRGELGDMAATHLMSHLLKHLPEAPPTIAEFDFCADALRQIRDGSCTLESFGPLPGNKIGAAQSSLSESAGGNKP